jgi:hypothetical protein
MVKREIYIPVLLFFLFITFLLAGAMVYISKARPGWIKTKIKIGAIILSLTTAVSCGSPEVTCYKTPSVKDSGQIKDNDTVKKDTILPKVKKDMIKSHKSGAKDTGWQDTRKTCYMPVRRDTGHF